MSQQFCLKWNNHMNNMMDVFKNLLSTESMVDVTLACDGLSLKAHKMVLSACSPFFQSLFLENPCKHPIVILKDMKYTELKAIIEFMYHGEVNVAQDQLSALMKTAETLRVKGLAEVTNEKSSQSNNSSQDEPGHRTVPRTDTPPPQNRRRRGRTRKRSLSDSNRSDDDSNEPKIKQPMSPEIEELSADVTMDASNSQFSNLQSQVPMQSTPSHSSNTFHKSSVITQDPQIEEPASADESEFGVEPAKLLEQTLTTEELNARRNRASNVEIQRRTRSSADHSTIVPTSMSSDTSNQQPDSPIDVKPELLELDPPMSPVAGPSHSSNDNAMMMYMDQSSLSSHPGPSGGGGGYQDNTALVPQDSQPQDLMLVKKMECVGLHLPQDILITEVRSVPPGEHLTEFQARLKYVKRVIPGYKDGDMVARYNHIIITRRDIRCLEQNNWINDQVINFYMNLIKVRNDYQRNEGFPSIFPLNSFFVNSICKEGGINFALSYSYAHEILAADLVLCPVHVNGNHWSLIEINNKTKIIKFYDSYGAKENFCLKLVKKFFNALAIKYGAGNSCNYRIRFAEYVPLQKNTYDCGIFLLMFAEFLSRKAGLTFRQEEMPLYRTKILVEICTGSLLKDPIDFGQANIYEQFSI